MRHSPRHGREQPPAPAQVVGHRHKPKLQARLGQPVLAHPAQALGALGGAKHLLEPGPHLMHPGVVCPQARQRRGTAPGACVHDVRRTTPSTDRRFGLAARISGVGVTP